MIDLTLSHELIRCQVSERAMWAALIVILSPPFDDRLDGIERLDLVNAQALISQLPVIGILCHDPQYLDRGPGFPCSAQSKTRHASFPDIRNPPSSTGLGRLQLSTTGKIRNDRPPTRVSCTKFMPQRSVGLMGFEWDRDATPSVSVSEPSGGFGTLRVDTDGGQTFFRNASDSLC
ncbi:MAG: hypothetical protein NPIRA06_14470 [Nitrospirales bacterium]|nr:MAG: hypothetical protein NPIRA06_14470 [Nitrospirales bacterium]